MNIVALKAAAAALGMVCMAITPPLAHKPTRDKIASAAGYAPKASVKRPVPATRPPVPLDCPLPIPTIQGLDDPWLLTPGFQMGSYSFSDGSIAPVVIGSPPFPSQIEPSPTIPEPASWAMLIAGFGLIGMVARRQQGIVT